jgi:hypothetical protein
VRPSGLVAGEPYAVSVLRILDSATIYNLLCRKKLSKDRRKRWCARSHASVAVTPHIFRAVATTRATVLAHKSKRNAGTWGSPRRRTSIGLAILDFLQRFDRRGRCRRRRLGDIGLREAVPGRVAIVLELSAELNAVQYRSKNIDR